MSRRLGEINLVSTVQCGFETRRALQFIEVRVTEGGLALIWEEHKMKRTMLVLLASVVSVSAGVFMQPPALMNGVTNDFRYVGIGVIDPIRVQGLGYSYEVNSFEEEGLYGSPGEVSALGDSGALVVKGEGTGFIGFDVYVTDSNGDRIKEWVSVWIGSKRVAQMTNGFFGVTGSAVIDLMVTNGWVTIDNLITEPEPPTLSVDPNGDVVCRGHVGLKYVLWKKESLEGSWEVAQKGVFDLNGKAVYKKEGLEGYFRVE